MGARYHYKFAQKLGKISGRSEIGLHSINNALTARRVGCLRSRVRQQCVTANNRPADFMFVKSPEHERFN